MGLLKSLFGIGQKKSKYETLECVSDLMAYDLGAELLHTPNWLKRRLMDRLRRDRRDFPEAVGRDVHTKKTYRYKGRTFRYVVFAEVAYMSESEPIAGIPKPGVLIYQMKVTRRKRSKVQPWSM